MSSVIDYVDLQESKVKKGVVLQASKIVREKTRNNKLNCCLFCGKYNTRISRHFTECHYRESEVARILSFPKRSLQRKQLWTKLVNRGNYEHNYEVIKEGSGMIVPKYRPREDEQKEAKLYIPCQFCFGTYKKEDLWKHQNRCPFKSPSVPTKMLSKVENSYCRLWERRKNFMKKCLSK